MGWRNSLSDGESMNGRSLLPTPTDPVMDTQMTRWVVLSCTNRLPFPGRWTVAPFRPLRPIDIRLTDLEVAILYLD